MLSIPVAGPSITDREVALVAEAARGDWYGDAGKFVAQFERRFAEYVGRRHAVALPSCTSGLHLALAALGVGPGDEVIVPETTWIATAAPISYVGATPVFADVDPQTWCLDPTSFRAAVTPRTKAVIPVDLYGGMPDFAALQAAADEAGVAMIEDAAEAIGSEYAARKAGAFGLASVFSFHGSKTLTTGEGGMLVTDDDALLQRIHILRDHGRRPGDVSFFNAEVGFKYKMTGLQAALGLGQLERIDELVRRKREIFCWYRDALADLPDVFLNVEPPHTLNSYWMSTLLLGRRHALSGGELQARLAARGIATRPFFHPLSSLPAYASAASAVGARERNPVAYDVSPRGVNLPSALSLTQEQVAYVCGELRACLA